MPQLEGPRTKNTQLCTGGLWGEKGKTKCLKKKKPVLSQLLHPALRERRREAHQRVIKGSTPAVAL